MGANGSYPFCPPQGRNCGRELTAESIFLTRAVRKPARCAQRSAHFASYLEAPTRTARPTRTAKRRAQGKARLFFEVISLVTTRRFRRAYGKRFVRRPRAPSVEMTTARNAGQAETLWPARLRPPLNRHILDTEVRHRHFAGHPEPILRSDPAALTGIQAVARLLDLCVKDGTD
jgi:hypothetical protein